MMLLLPKIFFTLSGDNLFRYNPQNDFPTRENLRALIRLVAPHPSANIKGYRYKSAVQDIFSDIPMDRNWQAETYGNVALYLVEQFTRLMATAKRSIEPHGGEHSSYVVLNSLVTESYETWSKFNLHWDLDSHALYPQGQGVTTFIGLQLVPVDYQVSFWINNATGAIRYTNWGFTPTAASLRDELNYLLSRLKEGHQGLKERLEPLNDAAKVRYLMKHLMMNYDDQYTDIKRGVVEGYTFGACGDNTEEEPPTLVFKIKRRSYDRETELSLLLQSADLEI